MDSPIEPDPAVAMFLRLLKAALPALFGLACLALAVNSLWSGKAPAFSRMDSIQQRYPSRRETPSQYWFHLTLLVGGAITGAYLAWKEYDE